MISSKPLLARVAPALLVSLTACFGTGVLPSTQTRLVGQDVVTLSRSQPAYLDVINAGGGKVVAKNVRLRIPAGTAGSFGLVEVMASDNCAALAVGEICTFTLHANTRSDAAAFPLEAELSGDNTNHRTVTLRLEARDPASQQPKLRASNVRLAPPAPTTGRILVTNSSRAAVTLGTPAVEAASGLVLDAASCRNPAGLAPGANCSLQVLAPPSSVPGTYSVKIPYFSAEGDGLVVSRATVVPGELIVNEGAPVLLDSNTAILPVRVRNTGFDLVDVSVSLPWSDTCQGALSLTVDAGSCQPKLAANGNCLVRLSTLGATPGTRSTIEVSDVTGTVKSPVQPVQVGSLAASPLSFAAPGQSQLHLTNVGTAPVYVLAVRVGGDKAGGFHVPSAADLAGCQGFASACNVPITATSEAFAGGGSSEVTVTYSAAGVVQTAVSQVAVAQVPVVVNGGNPLVLTAEPKATQVTLQNTGVFAWLGVGLQLVPQVPGVTVQMNCPNNLAPGASCNANVVVANNGQAATGVALTATGANPTPTSLAALTVQPAVLAVAKTSATDSALLTSYDGGSTWVAAPFRMSDTTLFRAAASANLWVAVGEEFSKQIILTSANKGASWQRANLSSVNGYLTGVAKSDAGWVAVGAVASSGNAAIRFSTDGLQWSEPTTAFVPSVFNAVSCKANLCVAVGSPESVANTKAHYSFDGGQTWQPDAATWSGPSASGDFYGAAAGPNATFAVVGAAASAPLLLGSTSGAQGPYAPTAAPLGLTGTLRAVAYNGARWLAVGNSSSALALTSTQANATAWTDASAGLGNGNFYGVTWTGSRWLVGGYAASTALLQSSPDASTWSNVALPASLLVLFDVVTAP